MTSGLQNFQSLAMFSTRALVAGSDISCKDRYLRRGFAKYHCLPQTLLSRTGVAQNQPKPFRGRQEENDGYSFVAEKMGTRAICNLEQKAYQYRLLEWQRNMAFGLSSFSPPLPRLFSFRSPAFPPIPITLPFLCLPPASPPLLSRHPFPPPLSSPVLLPAPPPF